MRRTMTTAFFLLAVFAGSLADGSDHVQGSKSPQSETDQDRTLNRDTPSSEKRTALVIGNGNYSRGKLKNPANDARAMAAALRDPAVGFDVADFVDLDLVGMKRAIRDFGTKLRTSGGVGLFYYAGHGVQVGGRNYLVPLGAETEISKESDVEIFCLDAESLLRQMEDSGARVNIVILDACRDNPFAASFRRGGPGGLAEISAPSGSFIAYATDPGKTASDGDTENGLFTNELLKHLREPGLRIEDVFNLAGADVERKSRGKQQPWISSKLRGAFYFRPPVGDAGKPGPTAGDPEAEAWNDIRDSKNPADFRAFLKEFPNGKYAGTARVKLARLENGQNPVKGAAGIEFVDIPAGEFVMGVDRGPYQKDNPARRVVIAEPFRMGKYEVTQAQWEAVMGSNPSQFKNCADCPVDSATWDEIWEFLQRLNRRGDGLAYSLPTEAEWEYACRAGTTGDFYAEPSEEIGWFKSNAMERTHPVGGKKPNALGLYDMHGNVWEYCAEDGGATASSRYVRGGAWFHGVSPMATAWFRLPTARTGRAAYIGFRIIARPAKSSASPAARSDDQFRTVTGAAGIEFVPLPAATFKLGADTGEDNEKPVHRVTITEAFLLGKYEVTQAQWEAVMGGNPSANKNCPDCPVEQVNWLDCQRFLEKLNDRKDGYVYSLPTEAEWEYACRAGTDGEFAGPDFAALTWFEGNSGGRPQPVGKKSPNAWGLHDMHGNVREWCADWFNEDYYPGSPTKNPKGPVSGENRAVRGGSWRDAGLDCRSSRRWSFNPSQWLPFVGFRVLARPVKP